MDSLTRYQQGAELEAATLQVEGGLQVMVLNLGASIASIKVPTRNGLIDAVLSYPRLEDYLDDPFFMGSTVGPYANRIGHGRFELDGREFFLQRNDASARHCLHGGDTGLHRQYFDLQHDGGEGRVTCRTRLLDGQGGFPGRRSVVVVYQLLSTFCLAIDFHVTTDSSTVVSLANHAYFTLGGKTGDQDIRVWSNVYTPVDDSMVPTGEVRSVEGSEFDLRMPTRVGDRVFDHNFALDKGRNELQRAATLRDPGVGLQLDLHTTQPGLQVYTGDHLSPPFASRQGLCLEAQGFPDAPNNPGFPATRLEQGQHYRQRTIYEFKPISV
ncbi:MAG: aldose epimerase family protein [Xanthomonadales bacterium]|nr:aldose epimerase family protein [Xanthomonadales bacterium]